MLLQGCRAGRLTVARLFTLGVLALTAVACGGGSLAPSDRLASSASQDGITIEPVVVANPMLASSLLAGATPVFSLPSTSDADATATATPVVSTSPTPESASPTASVSSTPGATPTPSATPRAATSTTPGPTATRIATPSRTVTVGSVQAATAAGAPSGDMSSQELSLINGPRTQAGLPALKFNGTLSASANAY